MMKFAVVIEQGTNSFGAYVPDLPGCVAVGESREEVTTLISEAIELHLEGLLAEGGSIPAPSTLCEYIDVPTPPVDESC